MAKKTSAANIKKDEWDWIAVLNEHSEWRGAGDITTWFAGVVGRAVDLSAETIQEFDESLSHLRTLVHALHFDRQPDIDWLNARLKNIRLALHLQEESGPIVSLPVLRACATGSNDSALLLSFRDTLFYQCAQFVGKALSGDDNLCRCEGLYRERKNLSSNREQITDEERLWREEIPLLADNNSDGEIQRCADLFIGTTRSKFCSDACRFNTFQINKQLTDPAYLVEKQRRYRKSKQP